MHQTDEGGPLSGVRIVALEQQVAAQYGTMLLADMGAEIVKVELPGVGDESRKRLFKSVDDGHEVSSYVLWNRNKRSVVIDLRTDQGKGLLRRLVDEADVFWTNLRPGSVERLGFGYEGLKGTNPDLIYATVSGFGYPDVLPTLYEDRPAFDSIVQALSGLMHVGSGPDRPPKWSGSIYGDTFSSMTLAWGVTLALLQRTRTGRGQRVDVAMYDAALMLNERAIGIAALLGAEVTQGTDNYIAPVETYPCTDGYLVIAPQSQRTWESLCQAIGREDLITNPELADSASRASNFRHVLVPIITEWTSTRTRAEVLDIMQKHQVPSAPVQTNLEVIADPQVVARKMILDLDDDSGRVRAVGNAIKLSDYPSPPTRPTPRLGEDTASVLADWLGMSADEISALSINDVI